MLQGILQIVALLVVLASSRGRSARYMARVYRGERTFLHPVLRPVERLVYRVCAIDENSEMGVRGYVAALLSSTSSSCLFVYAVLRLQGHLPLNPAHVPGMDAWTAFNTAVSFVTNTNWQVYVPETAVSYLTQMVGAHLAELRLRGGGHGRRRRVRPRAHAALDAASSATSGSTSRAACSTCCCRSAIVGALVLVSQGVIQNLDAPTQVDHARGRGADDRPGPVASQEIIKVLGTNGGGFFNANSAHPFENPTPLTEPPRDARDPRDPGGLHLHLRTLRGQPAAGLGAVRRDGRAVRARASA